MLKVAEVEIDDRPIERIALDDADGDLYQATALLTERICADPSLVRESFRNWAEAWANNKLRKLLSHDREEILHEANNSFGKHLSSAMSNEMTRFMDMPLYGGKRIADASPSEVEYSAERYLHIASDMMRKAKWQYAVADAAVKVGAVTIGSAMSEKQLAQLWEETNV